MACNYLVAGQDYMNLRALGYETSRLGGEHRVPLGKVHEFMVACERPAPLR
jgi:hypothetical protein